MLEDMEPDDAHAGARPGARLALLDLLSLGIVALTLLVAAWVFIVMRDPYGAFNPFPPAPPPTEVTIVPYRDGTQSAGTPPAWSAVPTKTATRTPTLPTTPTSAATPTPLIPTLTPTLRWTLTPSYTPAAFAYTLEGEAVTYTLNSNENGCAWQSIAGRVTGLNGEPIVGLFIHISGEGIDEMLPTGNQPTFGESGYELMLGDTPQSGEYVVELIGQDGTILSDQILVETLDRCEQNVALVNFVKNR